MKTMHRAPFSDCTRPSARHGSLCVCAKAARGDKPSGQTLGAHDSRREALLAAVAAPPKEARPGKSLIQVANLNSFQKKAEKEAFLGIVEEELRKALGPGDADATLKLVLHDAGTYDRESGTGGINGSIVTREELSRPENKDLQPIVDKLGKIRSAIEKRFEKQGFALISWADLEVLAVKVANEKDWAVIKKARGVPSSGDIISSAFGASWPVKLGRVDAESADPDGRLPKPDASAAEITTFFGKLNNPSYGATGFFAPKPPFDQRQAFILYSSAQKDILAAENKLVGDPELGKKYKEYQQKYETSRATVTRTDYEVDFIEYFNQLAVLGAKFDPDKYFVPIEIDTPKF